MGSSSSSYRAPVEAPNTLQSQQVVTILDVISEGEIVGLSTDDEKSIALNNTKLKTDAGAFTFNDVSWDIVKGTPDNNVLSGVDGIENEVNVSLEVTKYYPRAGGSGSGAVSKTITNLNNTHIRITLGVQALYQQLTDEDRSGDIIGATISYNIRIKDNDGYTHINESYTKTDKTRSSAQWKHLFSLDGTGPWTIIITKTYDDNSISTLSNDLYWYSYTEIIKRKFTFPNTAIVKIAGSAETFGSSIPSRAYYVKGVKIEVPTNYNSDDRSYSGIWDGTFKTAYSNNPAWVLRDIVENDRYGLKRFFPPSYTKSLLDKWSLYEIAKICDTTVSDGKGGAEPRYTINTQIQGAGDARDLIQSIAGVFHGLTYWGSNLIYAVADYPSDTVRTLNPTNIIDGSLSYSTGSATEKHSVAIVSYNDNDNFGASTIECVIDWDKIQRYGYREIKTTAYGCVSRGQAYRHGLWTLLSEDEQWQASLEQGLEGYDLMPGQVVKVADPRIMGVRYYGRIKSYSNNTVVLDDKVNLDANETYMLYVVDTDGNEESKSITSRGNSATITLSGNLSHTFSDNASWSISGTDAAPREFVIKSVKESDEGKVSIELREYNANKYIQLEDNIVLPTTPVRKQKGDLSTPTGLQVVSNSYISDGIVKQRITFSWSATGDSDIYQYEPQYQTPSKTWVNVTPQKTFSLDIPAASGGEYLFRVRSVAMDGRLSQWAEKSFTLANGSTQIPLAPTNLTAEGGYRNITVNWQVPNDVTIGYVEVLMSSDSEVDNATVVGKVYGSSFTIYDIGIMETRWIWVRSCSYLSEGIYSELVGPVNATSKALDMEDIPEQSIVQSKLVPELEKISEQIKLLANANLDNSFNGNSSAIAISTLNTNIIDGYSAEANARTLLATKLDDSLGVLQQQMNVVTRKSKITETTTQPESPIEGDIWKNGNVYKQFNGSEWIDVSDADVQGTLNSVISNYNVVTDVNGNIAGFGLKNSNISGSEFAILADSFKIAKTNGDKSTVFSVDSNGDVKLTGDLIASGTITGDKLNAASKIQLGSGGSLIMGNGTTFQMGSGAVVINSNDGILQIKNPNDLVYGDYIRVDTGNIATYKYLNGSYRKIKALRGLSTGTNISNNTTVTLDGYWPSTPKIMVSPCTLQSFNGSYPNQSQTLNVKATNIYWNSNTGITTFIPVAELIIAAGATQYVNSSILSNHELTTLTVYGSSQTIPANTSTVDISVDVYSASYKSEYIGEIFNFWATRCYQTRCTSYLNVDGTDYYIGSYAFPMVLYNRYQFEQYFFDATAMALETAGPARCARLSNSIAVPSGTTHTVYLKTVFTSDGGDGTSVPSPNSFDSTDATSCSGCWMKMINMVVNLAGTTTLATGTLNYMAIAE